MENKHTPGPWLVTKHKTKVFYKPIEKWMPGHVIAFVGEVPMNRAERTANAHLIAAAPDLFKVIEELSTNLLFSHAFGGSDIFFAAKAAYNKALNK